jgi:hypothetical protein
MPHRILREFGRGMDAERVHKIVFVKLHRLSGDLEDRGDLSVRVALGHQLKHFALASLAIADHHMPLPGLSFGASLLDKPVLALLPLAIGTVGLIVIAFRPALCSVPVAVAH